MLESVDYDRRFESACKTAQAMYQEHGHAVPVILAFKGGDMIGACDLRPVMDKREIAAKVMAEHMRETGTDAYVFISEAWSAKVTKDEMETDTVPKVMPRDRPDRVEVLYVQMETKDFSRARSYGISKGQVLGVWDDIDSRKQEGVNMGGIWSGLLK